jgi:osmoprotectant transport system permease protein
MSLLSDPRWGEALAHLPDYLGNHVRGRSRRAAGR